MGSPDQGPVPAEADHQVAAIEFVVSNWRDLEVPRSLVIRAYLDSSLGQRRCSTGRRLESVGPLGVDKQVDPHGDWVLSVELNAFSRKRRALSPRRLSAQRPTLPMSD